MISIFILQRQNNFKELKITVHSELLLETYKTYFTVRVHVSLVVFSKNVTAVLTQP